LNNLRLINATPTYVGRKHSNLYTIAMKMTVKHLPAKLNLYFCTGIKDNTFVTMT